MRTGQEGGPLKVFMLGWEFPPFISGGLGTACYGLTKAMDQLGIHVTFVLPKLVSAQYATHVRLLTPKSRVGAAYAHSQFRHAKFYAVPAGLVAYTTPDTRQSRLEEILQQKIAVRSLLNGMSPQGLDPGHYSSDMIAEVHRYAAIAAELAVGEDIDVIHAHDWMTYPAGIAVAAVTGRPLVVHVHSTEFDRSGEHVNQVIYDI